MLTTGDNWISQEVEKRQDKRLLSHAPVMFSIFGSKFHRESLLSKINQNGLSSVNKIRQLRFQMVKIVVQVMVKIFVFLQMLSKSGTSERYKILDRPWRYRYCFKGIINPIP